LFGTAAEDVIIVSVCLITEGTTRIRARSHGLVSRMTAHLMMLSPVDASSGNIVARGCNAQRVVNTSCSRNASSADSSATADVSANLSQWSGSRRNERRAYPSLTETQAAGW